MVPIDQKRCLLEGSFPFSAGGFSEVSSTKGIVSRVAALREEALSSPVSKEVSYALRTLKSPPISEKEAVEIADSISPEFYLNFCLAIGTLKIDWDRKWSEEIIKASYWKWSQALEKKEIQTVMSLFEEKKEKGDKLTKLKDCDLNSCISEFFCLLSLFYFNVAEKFLPFPQANRIDMLRKLEKELFQEISKRQKLIDNSPEGNLFDLFITSFDNVYKNTVGEDSKLLLFIQWKIQNPVGEPEVVKESRLRKEFFRKEIIKLQKKEKQKPNSDMRSTETFQAPHPSLKRKPLCNAKSKKENLRLWYDAGYEVGSALRSMGFSIDGFIPSMRFSVEPSQAAQGSSNMGLPLGVTGGGEKRLRLSSEGGAEIASTHFEPTLDPIERLAEGDFLANSEIGSLIGEVTPYITQVEERVKTLYDIASAYGYSTDLPPDTFESFVFSYFQDLIANACKPSFQNLFEQLHQSILHQNLVMFLYTIAFGRVSEALVFYNLITSFTLKQQEEAIESLLNTEAGAVWGEVISSFRVPFESEGSLNFSKREILDKLISYLSTPEVAWQRGCLVKSQNVLPTLNLLIQKVNNNAIKFFQNMAACQENPFLPIRRELEGSVVWRDIAHQFDPKYLVKDSLGDNVDLLNLDKGELDIEPLEGLLLDQNSEELDITSAELTLLLSEEKGDLGEDEWGMPNPLKRLWFDTLETSREAVRHIEKSGLGFAANKSNPESMSSLIPFRVRMISYLEQVFNRCIDTEKFPNMIALIKGREEDQADLMKLVEENLFNNQI